MKIHDIHIDGYGIWRDLRLADLSSAVTVVWGENEAGKSTLMHFLRDMLFDVQVADHPYLPPRDDGLAGGHLGLSTATALWQLDREWSRAGGRWQGTARWHRCEGGDWQVAGPPAEWTQVDRPLFENVFCLGLADLNALERLDAATAGELLYSLSTGLDRVTLHQIWSGLREAQDELQSGESGKLAGLWREWSEAKAAEETAVATGGRWISLSNELRECESILSNHETRRRELETAVEHLRLAEATSDHWRRLWKLEQDRAANPLSSTEYREQVLRWMHTERRERRWKREYQRQRRRFASLKQSLQRIEIHPELWEQRRTINALVDQQARLIWLQARQAASPVMTTVSPPSRPAVGADAADAPADAGQNGLAPELWSLLQRHAAEYDAAREEYERVEALIVETPGEGHAETASEPERHAELEKLGTQVTKLRRRLQVKQRLDKMVRHRKELQEEIEALLEQQVLPPQVLAYLGIPFVVGVMLILAGLVWSTASKLGWPVALLGLVGWIAAIAIKVLLEKSAAADLEEAQDQLATLQRQIASAKKEASELDRELPTSALPLDERLSEAEKRLETLEKQTTGTVSAAARQSLEKRLAAAEARLERAERQLQKAIGHCGLPSDFRPEQAADLPVRTTAAAAPVVPVPVGGTDDGVQQEYDLLAGRIRRLARQWLSPEVEEEAADPVRLLDALHSALVQEHKRRARRRQLLRRARRVRHRAFVLRRRIAKARRRRRELFAALDALAVGREFDLKELWKAHRDAETRYQETIASLQQALGKNENWKPVADIVRATTKEDLRAKLEQARHDLSALEEEKSATLERKGRLYEQRRQLQEQPSVEHVRWRRQRLESSLRELLARYWALGYSQQQLAHLQKEYEYERQPETLLDTSRYFHFLTQGRYDRVWTPWDQARLLVERQDGEQLAVEQLSTGTRELLFLALRLAIVAHYARHGLRLPVILDDVLVNLDRSRCRAACRLLAAFSEEGHQILFFTCHDHIAAALRDVGATIVSLHHDRAEPEFESNPPLAIAWHRDEPPASPPVVGRSTTADESLVGHVIESDGGTDDEAWEEEWLEDEDRQSAITGADDEEQYEEYEEADGEWEEEAAAEYEAIDEDEEYAESDSQSWPEVYDESEEEDSSEEDGQEADSEPHEGTDARHRRFTWDSPERWSAEDGEAA